MLLGSAILISSCGSADYSDCGSPDAQKVIDALIKEELGYFVENELDSSDAIGSYDTAKLEMAVKRLKIMLEDVRTSKDDPDSSRSMCQANLRLTIPENVEQTANNARAMAELDNIRKLANQYKIKRKGQSYEANFEYFIQPTDDKKKIFAEIDDNSPTLKFLGEVLSSYLLADQIRDSRIESDMAEAAEQREIRLAEQAELESEREMGDAIKQQAGAEMNEAKVENKMASDRIQAVWLAIPKETRSRLLPLQRAWIQKKLAQCKVESAGSHEIKEQREANRLRCDTRLTAQRINFLEPNTEYNDSDADEE